MLFKILCTESEYLIGLKAKKCKHHLNNFTIQLRKTRLILFLKINIV